MPTLDDMKKLIDSKYGVGSYNSMANDTIRQNTYNSLISANTTPTTSNANTTPITANTAIATPNTSDLLYNTKLEYLKGQLNRANANADANYNRSADMLNKSTDKALADAYNLRLAQQRNLAQQLSANGISGGGAESTILGLENNYANNRNSLESDRQTQIANLLYQLNTQKNGNMDVFANGEYEANINKLASQLKQSGASGTSATKNTISESETPKSNIPVTELYGGTPATQWNFKQLVNELRRTRPGITDEEIARIANNMNWG